MNAFAGLACGDPPQNAQVLTDVLTRPGGTGETRRATRDGLELDALVSGTPRLSRDKQDARRFSHNPAIYRARFVPEPPGTEGLQRSLAGSTVNGFAGTEQIGRLPETTS